VTPDAFRARILAGDVEFRMGDLAAARALFDDVIARASPRTDRGAVLATARRSTV
jgi:hypothetical protein